ncbi:ets DNA-binding protein pokkuri [Bacillus rossius redtenbacheri]|uniref:ets DNA-binding protein pokkuri n=1 Tax=Bacillus rossius redtenbacheri TaxID=93214 RepID=UPI002FDE7083
MKLLPLSLPPAAAMDRLPLSLPFSASDLLWRYPLGFSAQAPPASPLVDFKTHLPASLTTDPRVWSRDDVVAFLRWCEREFDLPGFEMDMFQMNGKALCLLTKGDLGERCPGAGDVLHNVLQLLVRDAQTLQRCLPSSPVTPTSRHYPPAHGWTMLQDLPAPGLAHLVHHGNSVTLSPAPSVDSQSGSPQHVEAVGAAQSYHSSGSNSNGSHQSDSDDDSYQESLQQAAPGGGVQGASPPPTPAPLSPGKEHHATAFRPVARDYYCDAPETNTNGRLLWDFLQQLLNDQTQRYTGYIAWKNRDTGVFKIVDPAGLAKLWGIQKNHLSMNYDKMSRALRYYYRVNILRKVQGERHCYQFLRNPSELKSIKNMSLLRQQMSPTRPAPPQGPAVSIKLEREEPEPRDDDEDLPTDLSMSPTARSRPAGFPLPPASSAVKLEVPDDK